ncbi:MAG TPA: DoxX family protein [Symbiobacteriaceae bacterium]
MVSRKPVSDPVFIQKLFSDARFSWLWLVIRLYVGYDWVTAGYHKLLDPKWMSTGEALKGFWVNVTKIPATGKPPITYDWYRVFLQSLLNSGAHTWFGKLITIGELTIGLCLILGLFTGIAAIFGAFMNLNFMLAGSASTNPVLFMLAGLLILAWKTSGYIGLDYWVLPALGTPWTGPGKTANVGGD